MKARAGRTDIIKVAAVSILSIGLFSAAFIGLNQLSYAVATSGTTPLYQSAGVTGGIVIFDEQAVAAADANAVTDDKTTADNIYNGAPDGQAATDDVGAPDGQAAAEGIDAPGGQAGTTEDVGAPDDQAAKDNGLASNNQPAAVHEPLAQQQQGAATKNIAVMGERAAAAEENMFIPPGLIIMESPYQQYNSTIPVSAMPPEEAAQIGARYIWDVFGANLEGETVVMMYAAHPSQTNTWWMGTVGIGDQGYSFTVNGVTGDRIDIMNRGGRPDRTEPGERSGDEWNEELAEIANEISNALLEAGFWDMAPAEQMAFAGYPPEAVEGYMQTAKDYASRHFNRSEVVEVRLDGINPSRTETNDGGGPVINVLCFFVTDDTGREAFMTITTEDNPINFVSISTQHNDYIPVLISPDHPVDE